MYIDQTTYNIYLKDNGNSFEVDPLIAKTIQILNRKGYKTAHCCSGHSSNERIFDNENLTTIQFVPGNAYIAFEEGIELPSLPEGFEVDIPNIVAWTVDDEGNRLEQIPISPVDGEEYFNGISIRNEKGRINKNTSLTTREKLQIQKTTIEKMIKLQKWANSLPPLEQKLEENPTLK